MLLEAALAATAPAERAALYEQVQPTVSHALEYCFPQLGPNGNLKKSKLPTTPLADEESRSALRLALAASQARAQAAAEQGEPPIEWVSAPALFREPPAEDGSALSRSPVTPLSPKTDEATAGDTTTSTSPPAPETKLAAERSRALPPETPEQLSPKTHNATLDDTTTTNEATSESTTAIDEPPIAIDYNLPIDFNLAYDDFAAAIAGLDQNEQAILWDQRLRHRAAKKRAAASRRRNAA